MSRAIESTASDSAAEPLQCECWPGSFTMRAWSARAANQSVAVWRRRHTASFAVTTSIPSSASNKLEGACAMRSSMDGPTGEAVNSRLGPASISSGFGTRSLHMACPLMNSRGHGAGYFPCLYLTVSRYRTSGSAMRLRLTTSEIRFIPFSSTKRNCAAATPLERTSIRKESPRYGSRVCTPMSAAATGRRLIIRHARLDDAASRSKAATPRTDL